MAIDYNNTIRSNHAAVMVWNYTDRFDADNVNKLDVNAINSVIISTVSLMSISTSKQKSNPVGQFALVLAPTKNWIEALTPGSWLAIMMGTRPITADDFQTAAPDLIKMLGRIDSVRMNVGIDQASGQRQTTYIVQGQDWGQIFTTNIYVDPIARGPNESAIGTTERLTGDSILTDFQIGKLPSTTRNVSLLLRLIARPIPGIQDVQEQTGVLIKPENNFVFPQKLVNFFGFKELDGSNSVAVGDAIEIISGVLTDDDTYQEVKEAIGFINPNTIVGDFSLWQLMTDNCNSHLNELVTDLSFSPLENAEDAPSVPSLVLYKRIKPFIISDDVPDLEDAENLISRFTNIKHVEIPLDNVISMNIGNNWRDKYNFVEMQLDKQYQVVGWAAAIKEKSQSYDKYAFAREGFRPMRALCNVMPTDIAGAPNPIAITNWKGLLRAWYFNTHNLLNGSITFLGIPDHIKVGDNIMVDATVMGKTYNYNETEQGQQGTNNAFLLLHVESIAHNFTVDPNGVRSFSTTISFVRGIIVGANGKQFDESSGDGAADTTSGFSDQEEQNSVNVLFTETSDNPNSVKSTGN